MKMIFVKQTKSSAKLTKRTKGSLVGLGLGRIGKVKALKKTPEIMGMVFRVKHLIEVKEGGKCS